MLDQATWISKVGFNFASSLPIETGQKGKRSKPGPVLTKDHPRVTRSTFSRDSCYNLSQNIMEFLTTYWPVILIVVLVLMVLTGWLFTVPQQELFLIERLGKFVRTAHPGLNAKIPFFESIRGKMSLRVREIDIPGDFKTKDNVFIGVMVRVQYFVLESKIYDAFYRLTNPEQQIAGFVLNTVRAEVARMNLQDVFEHQDAIGTAVNTNLSQRMADFGFEINNSLITAISPAAEVVAALNKVLATQNLKQAAQNEGEALKIKAVLDAEASSASKKLQGEGVAAERIAIARGILESAKLLEQGIPGVSNNEAMKTLLITQYFDVIKDIGAKSGSRVIFLPSSPQGLKDAESSIASFLAASEAGRLELTVPPVPPKA